MKNNYPNFVLFVFCFIPLSFCLLLLYSFPASAEGPNAWLNITYTDSEQFKDGDKTGSSNGLLQNYYFNYDRPINPLLSLQFHLRTAWIDLHNTDDKGNKTSSYTRALEPAVDVFLHNPMYGIEAGYRRLEQWSAAHLKDETRTTNEYYYSRFNLTPPKFPFLYLQFERTNNFDHASVQKIDLTNDRYSASSWYLLDYKDLKVSYNLTFTREENKTPTNQSIPKTIRDSLNGNYNITYSKSLLENKVSIAAGYQGNYVWTKNEQFVTETGNVSFKRSPSLGIYGLGTQIEPNVDTLISVATLSDSVYNIPAASSSGNINIGQNGIKFNNIGIELFSSEKPVDTLYIYVNKDVTSDTGLINTVNWRIYGSNFNQIGTWTEITIQTINISVYDFLNNIYRYEIKFSVPQKSLYYRAINMDTATINDVLVTEIEAFGTDNVPQSGKIEDSSTFFTQGLNFGTTYKPINSLILSVNYYMNRSDLHPKSIIDSIGSLFSTIYNKLSSEKEEEFTSNVTRSYGANATWLTHRLLTTTVNFYRNESFDNKETVDYRSDSYSLRFNSTPLPTLDTTLSLIKTYSYNFEEKQAMSDLYIFTVVSKLYRDVNMVTDVGYTRSKTYAIDIPTTSSISENTQSSYSISKYIRLTLNASLTPRLYSSVTYGVNNITGDTSSTTNDGSVIVTYRPGKFINLTGIFRFNFSEEISSTAEGISADWLPLPAIRFNFLYEHRDDDNGQLSTARDSVSGYLIWYITKFLQAQITSSYTNNMSVTKTEDYEFMGTLTCRFW